MSKLNLALAAAALSFVLARPGFAVTNAVVGTCKAGTQFTTIEAAVKAATSGSIVQVCPGTYAEQIDIETPLTLKGVAQGLSNQVVIRPPARGLVSNAKSQFFVSLFANVLVHTPGVANVTNIVIDGGGGTSCPVGGDRVGLLYQGGGGLVSNVTVINSPQCGQSIAAMADATTGFTFTGNVLTDCGGICFELDFGDTTTLSNNNITQFKNAYLGIEVRQISGAATLSGNTITGNFLSAGIFTTDTSSLTITGNNVVIPQGATGITLQNATLALVQSNRITAGYGITVNDFVLGAGNTIKSNTIREAICGLDLLNSGSDVVTPNTFYSTQSATCSSI
jgi:hypothetical protein